MSTRLRFGEARRETRMQDNARQDRRARTDALCAQIQREMRASNNRFQSNLGVRPLNVSYGGTQHIGDNRFIEWLFEMPKSYCDALAMPFKWGGVTVMFGMGFTYPFLCFLRGRVTLDKDDREILGGLLRITAFFWFMYGVIKGSQKIAQLFEKYQTSRSTSSTL